MAGLTELAKLTGQEANLTAIAPPSPEATRGLQLVLADCLQRTLTARLGLQHSQFPFDTFALDASLLHPPPAQIAVYQNVFFQNIDPVMKVLHRPSVEALLGTATLNPTTLRDGESAIAFSIYLASLCSMSDDDASACCGGIPKQSAVAAYKGAVEHALARAKLLTTSDLTTLQAFLLYIGLSRFVGDAHRAWTLLGMAGRLASAAISETTTSTMMASPFEREMLKRLQMVHWYLEHRVREDLGHGSSSVPGAAPAELPVLPVQHQPTNARDVDLHHRIGGPPTPHQGWTEVSFALLQFEIAAATRMVHAASTRQYKEAVIDVCEKGVWERYLRHCDGTLGVHWLAKHVAYVLIMELRFRVLGQWPPPEGNHDDNHVSSSWHYLSPPPAPPPEQLFAAAVDILDAQPSILQVEPQAAQWSWLMRGYMQFWPLRFVLGHLCSSSPQQQQHQARVWNVAERSFRRWRCSEREDNGNSGGSYQFEVLKRLWGQAREARAARQRQWECWSGRNGHGQGLIARGGSMMPGVSGSNGEVTAFPTPHAVLADSLDMARQECEVWRQSEDMGDWGGVVSSSVAWLGASSQ